MEDRCLLHRIDPVKGTVTLPDGKEYPMLDTEFPTIDWKHPYELTAGERDVIERMETAFRNCENFRNICVCFWIRVVCTRYIMETCFSMDVFPE